MFDRDFRDLLSVFDAHKVEYLIVGGYAVSLHAQPRATKDLNLWIGSSPANARAVHRALAAFGAPMQGIEAEDFADPDMLFRMGRPPLMVDILTTIVGATFEDAWQHRVSVVIDPQTDLSAWFISRDDLLAAKAAAGRPQDLADVAALQDSRPDDEEAD